MVRRSRITEDDIRAGRARFVQRGGYVQAEWAPPGTQLRIPMPPQPNGQTKR